MDAFNLPEDIRSFMFEQYLPEVGPHCPALHFFTDSIGHCWHQSWSVGERTVPVEHSGHTGQAYLCFPLAGDQEPLFNSFPGSWICSFNTGFEKPRTCLHAHLQVLLFILILPTSLAHKSIPPFLIFECDKSFWLGKMFDDRNMLSRMPTSSSTPKSTSWATLSWSRLIRCVPLTTCFQENYLLVPTGALYMYDYATLPIRKAPNLMLMLIVLIVIMLMVLGLDADTTTHVGAPPHTFFICHWQNLWHISFLFLSLQISWRISQCWTQTCRGEAEFIQERIGATHKNLMLRSIFIFSFSITLGDLLTR